jgi:hypothetical protein
MVTQIPADARDQILHQLDDTLKVTGYEWRHQVKTLVQLLHQLSHTTLDKARDLEEQLTSGKLETYVANPLGEIQGAGQRIDLLCGVIQRMAVEYGKLADLKKAIVTELESSHSEAAAVTRQLKS